MGAFGEHKGVRAPYTHSPSHQPQCPGQSSMAQRGNFATITARYHDDSRKQRDRNSNQPHLNSRWKCSKKPQNLWIKQGEAEISLQKLGFWEGSNASFQNKIPEKWHIGYRLCLHHSGNQFQLIDYGTCLIQPLILGILFQQEKGKNKTSIFSRRVLISHKWWGLLQFFLINSLKG